MALLSIGLFVEELDLRSTIGNLFIFIYKNYINLRLFISYYHYHYYYLFVFNWITEGAMGTIPDYSLHALVYLLQTALIFDSIPSASPVVAKVKPSAATVKYLSLFLFPFI